VHPLSGREPDAKDRADVGVNVVKKTLASITPATPKININNKIGAIGVSFSYRN
jgi:hypothetical protein